MNGRMSPAFLILPTTPTFTRRRGFLSSPGRASPSAWHGPVRPRATARTGCARASAGGLSGYSAACFLFRFPHAPPDHAILFPPGTGAHCHHGGVGRDLSDHSRRPAPFWPPVFRVRPAWAHTCGCKSRHKLATVSEVKRNCTRATECGKEAWSVICGPMYKNRIQGVAEQGERACNREALVAKAR